jgi:hypothetical protein
VQRLLPLLPAFIRQLPPGARAAVEAHLANEPHAVTAAKQGISEETNRQRLRYGLLRLRALMNSSLAPGLSASRTAPRRSAAGGGRPPV